VSDTRRPPGPHRRDQAANPACRQPDLTRRPAAQATAQQVIHRPRVRGRSTSRQRTRPGSPPRSPHTSRLAGKSAAAAVGAGLSLLLAVASIGRPSGPGPGMRVWWFPSAAGSAPRSCAGTRPPTNTRPPARCGPSPRHDHGPWSGAVPPFARTAEYGASCQRDPRWWDYAERPVRYARLAAGRRPAASADNGCQAVGLIPGRCACPAPGRRYFVRAWPVLEDPPRSRSAVSGVPSRRRRD
jgi:hypothetical protein